MPEPAEDRRIAGREAASGSPSPLGLQIRSRAGNRLLVGFGASLLALAGAAVFAETRDLGRFDPAALVFVALLGLPGLWCIAGGASNLRRRRLENRLPRRSRLARLVQADMAAIVVSSGVALACLAPEWRSGVPRLVGAFSLYALILSLLAVPALLAAAALAARASARRRDGSSQDR